MTCTPSRAARAGERLTQSALSVLLLVALLVQLARGGTRVVAPEPAGDAGVALTVDLAWDPAWRLSLLPGIGRGRAWEIVRDRERNGPVSGLEALQRVRDIGPRTVARLRGARSVRVLLAGKPVGCPP